MIIQRKFETVQTESLENKVKLDAGNDSKEKIEVLQTNKFYKIH